MTKPHHLDTERKFKIALGKLITKTREDRGFTATEVARILKCSKQLVSHWEHGRTLPVLTDFVRWAQLMQVSAGDIIDRANVIVRPKRRAAKPAVIDERSLKITPMTPVHGFDREAWIRNLLS